MTSKRAENILQFRVSLDHIEPRIWRRIELPDSYTLKQLHRIIQIVMGWQNSHLHEFSLNGKRYGEPNPEDEPSIVDERAIRLRDLALSNGDGIGYVYDFGDDWQHQIVLEAKLVSAPQSLYPTCIAGERNSPPEDVGGIDGYAEFLDAIANPDHEEHDATLEWVGGHFDPEAFSVTGMNERLRRGLRPDRKR